MDDAGFHAPCAQLPVTPCGYFTAVSPCPKKPAFRSRIRAIIRERQERITRDAPCNNKQENTTAPPTGGYAG